MTGFEKLAGMLPLTVDKVLVVLKAMLSTPVADRKHSVFRVLSSAERYRGQLQQSTESKTLKVLRQSYCLAPLVH